MAIIKVQLIASTASFGESLPALLNKVPDISVVAGAAIPCAAVESVGQISTDVVVISISSELSECLDAIHSLRSNEPGVRIVALSEHEDPEIMFLVLHAGANALLLARTRDQKKIADAIRGVYSGGTFVSHDAADIMIPHYLAQRKVKRIADPLERLSSREREVLTLVIDGEPSSEIARRLSISPKSVGTYRSRLMKKLGVKDLPSLIKFAIRHDLTSSWAHVRACHAFPRVLSNSPDRQSTHFALELRWHKHFACTVGNNQLPMVQFALHGSAEEIHIMTPRFASLRGIRLIILPALVGLVLLAAFFVFASTTSAQTYPNPQYQGPGQFCLDDAGYPSGPNCTANDTRITALTPTLTEVCTAVGDTATASFTANLVIGASTRYDLAMYIATNGGSAYIGSSCYKDVLQPVATLDAAGNPTNPAGTGPFKNEDGDLCGEANSTVPPVYKLQQTLQILCVDTNNDGVVDPINTCVSWANNADQFSCQGVTDLVPGPGTTSKCDCNNVAPNPPVLLYRGYDFGDLPDTYGTVLPNGARHAIQDTNNDGTPNVQGGVPAIWLGTRVDFAPTGETDGQPSANADGDDINSPGPGVNPSDEDGVAFPGPWYYNVPAGGKATVVVAASDASACAGNKCYVGYWIDWDGSGTFNPAAYPGGEYYVAPVTVGTNNLTFPVPTTWTTPVSIRFRLYYQPTGVQGSYLPTGLSINGEVEDYKVNNTPQAVALASFAATCQAETPVITWETVSEVDTAGFNVWRSNTAGAPEIQLNASMIPAHPGSTQGYSYSWTDSTAVLGQTYYYWLEDVDINGATGLNGPIEALCTGPTAVTVSDLEAKGSATPTTVWWAPLIALIVGIGLAILLSRRAKTA